MSKEPYGYEEYRELAAALAGSGGVAPDYGGNYGGGPVPLVELVVVAADDGGVGYDDGGGHPMKRPPVVAVKPCSQSATPPCVFLSVHAPGGSVTAYLSPEAARSLARGLVQVAAVAQHGHDYCFGITEEPEAGRRDRRVEFAAVPKGSDPPPAARA
jgi:hypothetical protein